MDNAERDKLYGTRLTPARRRRLKHKEKSRKTHSHVGLPEYLVDRATTQVKRVPCERCSPKSKKHIRIGGS